VSARATHLKAAIEKVSMATIERKRMSIKTNFKRIALVAVSALGLGVIPAVQSQAAVSGITITVVNGTKTASALTLDTTTGATVSISALATTYLDSVIVTITPKTVPSGQTGVMGVLLFNDTVVSGVTVPTTDTVQIRNATSYVLGEPSGGTGRSLKSKGDGTGRTAVDSIVAYNGATSRDAYVISSDGARASGGGNSGYVSGSFRLYLDTVVSRTAITAGTYTYTVTATPYSVVGSAVTAGTAVTADVSIVVSNPTISGGNSTAYIGTSTGNTSDLANAAAAADASNTTAAGYLTVKLLDANSAQIPVDTVTVTTTIGNLGTSSAVGKSVQFNYSGSALNVALYADGTAGTASVCASTLSGVTFACKSFTFYSDTVAKIVLTQLKSTLAVGTNSTAFAAKATDANGVWIADGSLIYIFSSATGVVSDTATAATCTAVNADQTAYCSLTGVAAGTATIVAGSSKVKATASNTIDVRVTNNAIASIALTTNKATAVAGEKVIVRLTAKDAAGNSVAPQEISNFFASGGISTDIALGNGSDTMTGTTVKLTNYTTTGYATGDAVYQWTVYMPQGATSVTFSATGGTGLPAAAQVKVSTTVAVTDSGAQALAAATALASQISAFITKINAQITTLTDLVMKIQKKVKA